MDLHLDHADSEGGNPEQYSAIIEPEPDDESFTNECLADDDEADEEDEADGEDEEDGEDGEDE